MIDKTLRMALLFDAYGNVLTPKQREFFSLYYNDDLSLGEIASNYQISRQAVYDMLKRSETTLNHLEQHLGLVTQKEQQRIDADQMLAALDVLTMVISQAAPELQAQATKALAVLRTHLQTATDNEI